MTEAERRRRAEDVCDAALQHGEADRARFVSEACGDDNILQQEVDALLRHAQQAELFLATPIGAVAANILSNGRTSLEGRRVGVYQILSVVGAGGMGAVYRARDTRLKRDVAVKVLLPEVAHDPERLARFEREAQLVAAVNHPNIAAIFGVEQASDTTALVLEFVDGPTLADRITRGPIRLEEALPIARQIAEALEAAHEQGIIHRDLKPSNIKVREDGTVKVLDFGLAKLIERAGDASGSERRTAQSAWITTPSMTETGVILGTAAYMSPEQAKGNTADKRTDIWAFGCVLYEMLSGHQAFDGDSASERIAAVLEREPNWANLPSQTPPRVLELLQRCLRKDRKRRLADIGDARLELEDCLAVATQTAHGGSKINHVFARRVAPWVSVIASAAIVAVVMWAPWRLSSRMPRPMELSVQLGIDGRLGEDALPAVDLSPDGSLIAFIGQRQNGGPTQLYIRRLTELDAAPITGTEGAFNPVFSPNGEWVAFFAAGKLKKVGTLGSGSPVTLCDALGPRGLAWASNGTIVFSPDIRPGTSLWRVSSEGGKPEPFTKLADGETTQRWPQILSDGRTVLFTSGTTTGAFGDANIIVQSLSTGSRKIVQRGAYYGRYLPSGHLVFLRNDALLAAPFDLARTEVTGPTFVAVDHVKSNAFPGSAQFSVSSNGTLLYVAGSAAGGVSPVRWGDRQGATALLRETPANWSNPRFASDGHRVALEVLDEQSDIWIADWSRDALTRLTSDPAEDTNPVWTPDGRRIVFASTRADRLTPNLYWQLADGTGRVERLTESNHQQLPGSWHPNGKLLAFEDSAPETGRDLMLLSIEGNDESGWKPGTPSVLLRTPFEEGQPAFSPDGRWLAYVSTESGRPEVYVQPFPELRAKWQVSTSGGMFPTWSRTKQELFYSTGAGGAIMVAPYIVETGEFQAGKPQTWATWRPEPRGLNRMFDLHPDGERFAVRPRVLPNDGPNHVTLIINFFEVLHRLSTSQ